MQRCQLGISTASLVTSHTLPWQHDLSKITSNKSGDFPVVVGFFVVCFFGGRGADGADTIWHFSHRKWCERSSKLNVINEQRVLPRALPKSQSTLAESQRLHNSIWESLRSETTPRLQNEPRSCCAMLSEPRTIWDLGCFVFVCYDFVMHLKNFKAELNRDFFSTMSIS